MTAEGEKREAAVSLRRCPHPEAVKGSDFAPRHPACSLVAAEEADHGCTVLLPDDTRLRVRWISPPAWASFSLAAPAVHAWTKHCPVRERVRIEVRVGNHLAPAQLEASP